MADLTLASDGQRQALTFSCHIIFYYKGYARSQAVPTVMRSHAGRGLNTSASCVKMRNFPARFRLKLNVYIVLTYFGPTEN